MTKTTDKLQLFEQGSIILLHGVFDPIFFRSLKKDAGKHVVTLEGRPGLEAARKSQVELAKRKIIPTLISDNMAGFLLYKGLVKEVWLAYQSYDGNGALCQIGGLILGVLGKKHNVPVYIYPNDGRRKLMGKTADISFFNGVRVAPRGVSGYVPLAEWVPVKYITKVYGQDARRKL